MCYTSMLKRSIRSAWILLGEAQQHWVRVQSNQALGAYEVYEAQGELTDPVWPEESWQKLVHVAFKGKIIDTHDHIVLQKLRGEL